MKQAAISRLEVLAFGRFRALTLSFTAALLFTATASASTLPAPIIAATQGVYINLSPVVLSMQTSGGGSFSADFFYQFRITGGQDGDFVPLHVETTLYVFAAGDPSKSTDAAGANIYVNGITSAQVNLSCSDIHPGDCLTWSGIIDVMGYIGLDGNISLEINGGTQEGFASAYADPHIYIDPAFLAAHQGAGYGIELPDGVGNQLPASTSPEPASLLLVGSVFAAVFAYQRRKRLIRPEAV